MYLLGRKPPYILLDTGDGKPEYTPVGARKWRLRIRRDNLV